ncbi:MAG: hypothetical protein PHF33_02335 [Candidatus Delongbacteria bacterium]|nr:hypothetical protein [Candidatus Delongbacteria bacterium]
MSFELKYPLMILAVSLAAVYFAVRYYLQKEKLPGKSFKTLFWLKYIFLSGAVLIMFDPEIIFKNSENILQKHILLFDNSSSVPRGGETDTSSFRSVLRRFSKDESFIFYKFGSESDTLSSPDMLDYTDNFSSVSSSSVEALIERAVSKENAVSVILFTDGNFTDANNFSLRTGLRTDIVHGTPVTEDPDIFIKMTDYNDNPAPGSEKDITVIAGYEGYPAGGDFTLTVSENNRTLIRKTGKIPAPGTFVTLKVELPEMNSDLRELELSITPLKGEKNLFNNKKTAVQRLLTSSSVFLVVSDAPSLDLSFFLKLLGSSGYSFELFYGRELNKITDTGKYSALISFNMPVRGTFSSFEKIAKEFRSKLFFTGGRTDLAALDRITGAGLKNYRYLKTEGFFSGKAPDAGGFLMQRGSMRISMDGLPGIEYDQAFVPSNKNTVPLLTAEGKSSPAVLFMNRDEKDLTLISTFRSFWKLLFNDRSDNFSSLMLNIIDLTAVDRKSERIRIASVKPEYYSGEKTVLSGNILDENLRPVQDAAAEVTVLENSLKSQLKFENGEWSAGFYIAEPGVYTARIRTGEADGGLTKDIKFRILQNDLETARTGSDTLYLKSFARARNGEAFPADSAEAMLKRRSGNFDTVSRETSLRLTVNLWYFLFLLLIFIAELTIRKYKDLS